MKAEERQKLKHDKYAETMFALVAWARGHLTPILVGAAALLIIAAAIAWTVYSRQQAHRAANDLLQEMQMRAQAALLEKPEARQEAVKEAVSRLESLASSYPNSDAAPLALLYAGQTLSAAGQKAEAIAYFERAARKAAGRTGVAMLARRGMAQALEDSGKYREAIEQYRWFAQDDSAPEAVQANWDIGRCYEALKELDKARQHYEKAAERGGDNTWAQLARFRLANLSKAPAQTTLSAPQPPNITVVPTPPSTTALPTPTTTCTTLQAAAGPDAPQSPKSATESPPPR